MNLHTRSGLHALDVRVANTFLSRLRGLMLSAPLAPGAGLLLLACPSVHCAFMRYAIDVVYLGADGTVLKCVPQLRPWRASASNSGRDAQGRRHRRAAHTLELAAGSIARLAIAPGDRAEHPLLAAPAAGPVAPAVPHRQRGASLVEFVVVGPILTLLGLALVQYGMLFFAKNQINHAGFMAARAGSAGNASLAAVRDAYAIALVPMYGGGQSPEALAKSLVAARADVELATRIEMLSPTKESFDDWNSPELQKRLNTSKRVIPNSNQAFKSADVGATSGQTIQDANLIKLRITQGYKPSVPLVSGIYRSYMKWLDPKTDTFHTEMVSAGRIPVVSHVTLEMQSDPIEDKNISLPGKGNDGKPVNPGDTPPPTGTPPDCSIWRKCDSDPVNPGGGGGSGPGGGGGVCEGIKTTDLATDALFEFGKYDLLPAGKAELDKLIAAAKNAKFEGATVTGYTDQIGQEQDNLELSRKRAQAVTDYLRSHGFPDVPITTTGKGEANPKKALSACPASGAAQVECLKPNRRVTVELKGTK